VTVFHIFINIGEHLGILALLREDVLATLTIKWDAAASPIILLRRAMGRTSAP
jgi:hypothetical protein